MSTLSRAIAAMRSAKWNDLTRHEWREFADVVERELPKAPETPVRCLAAILDIIRAGKTPAQSDLLRLAAEYDDRTEQLAKTFAGAKAVAADMQRERDAPRTSVSDHLADPPPDPLSSLREAVLSLIEDRISNAPCSQDVAFWRHTREELQRDGAE